MLQADFIRAISPFRPFRIITTNGETYDIRHREGFILTPTYLTVGLLPGPGAVAYERTTTLDLFHIVRLEDLPGVPTIGKGNGQAGQES